MPGSSPIEELTAAIDDIQRAINKINDNAGYAHIKQPLGTVADTLSQQLKAMRDLFQPQASTAPQNTQLQQDTWPRAQIVPGPKSPLQRVKLPIIRIAPVTMTEAPPQDAHVQVPSDPTATVHVEPADPPSVTMPAGGNTSHQNPIVPITGQFQRVKPKQGSKQKPKPANNITQEPILLPSQVVIPVNSQQIIALPTKIRSQHSYWPLTLTEIKKLPSATIKRVGMKFIDNKDPADVCTGII